MEALEALVPPQECRDVEFVKLGESSFGIVDAGEGGNAYWRLSISVCLAGGTYVCLAAEPVVEVETIRVERAGPGEPSR
jgi:hypothetical protein